MEENNKRVIPGWKIIRIIGRGGFGTVYEVEKEDDFGGGIHSALKIISVPESRSEVTDLRMEGYDDQSMTELFRSRVEDITSEFRLMNKMKGCSNIVSFEDYTIVQHDGDPGYDVLIRMELLTSLPEYIHLHYESIPITDTVVQKIGIDICNALELCREYSIIHRDIKPQNIFVNDHGDFKLGDFGIAKTSDHTTRATKTGTFGYMAPEVYLSKPYNASVDIYSLGLVMYWMLNERRGPFLPLPPVVPKQSQNTEALERRMSGEPLPVPKHGSEELKRIVLKACAFDPKDRYANPTEMKHDLERLSAKTYVNSPSFKGEMTMANSLSFDDEATVALFTQKLKTADESEKQKNVTVQNPVQHDETARESKPVQESAERKEAKKPWIVYGIIAISVIAVAALAVMVGIRIGREGKSMPPEPTSTPTLTQSTASASIPISTSAPTPIPTSAPTPLPTQILSVYDFRDAKVGSIIEFGVYEQDNDLTNGSEIIEWRVLKKENGKLLVISNLALDCRQYDSSNAHATWDACSLREWLNGAFLDEAFNADEQRMICNTVVTADRNPEFKSVSPGNNIESRIFLLSMNDVMQGGYFTSKEDRMCAATEYAMAHGAHVTDQFSRNHELTCWWWLRTPGEHPGQVARVNSDGYVFSSGSSANFDKVAVRPAMWILQHSD